jgi:hypothetical protein
MPKHNSCKDQNIPSYALFEASLRVHHVLNSEIYVYMNTYLHILQSMQENSVKVVIASRIIMSSWLQIQRSVLYSRCYQIFWEAVGPERGPLSLVSTIEELLGRKSSGLGLESREYGRRDPLRWPRGTLYPQKLALSLPTSWGRSVNIVWLRTQATELF